MAGINVERDRKIRSHWSCLQRTNTATTNRSYYEAGHIFLQKLFYQMGWNKMSGELKKGTDSEIPMNAILQMLLYTRILQPHSKKASWEISRNYLPGARE